MVGRCHISIINFNIIENTEARKVNGRAMVRCVGKDEDN
jgi:hypothetical protein